MKRKRFLSLICALLVCALLAPLAGCDMLTLPSEEEELAPPLVKPMTIDYKTVTVDTGDIRQVIAGNGNLVADQMKNVQFEKTGGRLERIHVRAGDQVKEGDLIAELQTSISEYAVREMELRHAQAVITYNQILDNFRRGLATRYDRDRAEIEMELADLYLERTRNELDNTRIVAPFDGEITFVADYKIGDWIDTYRTIVTVADLSHLQVRYPSAGYERIPLGAEVTFKLLNYKGEAKDKIFTGRVVSTPSDVPSDAHDSMRQAVYIEPDEKLPGDIKLGGSVSMEYVVAEGFDVVILPRRLVQAVGNRNYVNVLIDGYKEERDVEIGIVSATAVEIVSGLEPGELIIER